MKKKNEEEVVAGLVELQRKTQKFCLTKFVAENYELIETNKKEKRITYAEMAEIIGVSAGQLTNTMSRLRKKRAVGMIELKQSENKPEKNKVLPQPVEQKQAEQASGKAIVEPDVGRQIGARLAPSKAAFTAMANLNLKHYKEDE